MQLKEYIKSNNLQFEGFAKGIGISPTSFFNYLSGIRRVPLEIAARIIKYTDGKVTIEDLIELQKNRRGAMPRRTQVA